MSRMSRNVFEAKRRLTRREFTAASVATLFVGMGVTLTGCGGGSGGGTSSPSGPSGPTGPAANGDRQGDISANHGHVAVVTAAQLAAGGGVTLDINGSAGHPHRVDLSAAEVAQIAAGTRVTKTSVPLSSPPDYGSFGPHEHTVTFN